jgi:hypothetical protein
MADRTLRRTYVGTIPIEESISDSDGRGDGSEQERDAGIEDADRIADFDGKHDESDADGSGGIGTVTIEPESLAEFVAGDRRNNSDGNGARKQRKKRGPNKPKSGTKKAKETIAPFIMFIHNVMATKVPEMMLEEKEAEQLSDAYSSFCEHHDIPVLSDKRISEINLVMAIFTVYGTRAMAIRNRLKEEARIKKARNVTPIM